MSFFRRDTRHRRACACATRSRCRGWSDISTVCWRRILPTAPRWRNRRRHQIFESATRAAKVPPRCRQDRICPRCRWARRADIFVGKRHDDIHAVIRAKNFLFGNPNQTRCLDIGKDVNIHWQAVRTLSAGRPVEKIVVAQINSRRRQRRARDTFRADGIMCPGLLPCNCAAAQGARRSRSNDWILVFIFSRGFFLVGG